MQNVPSALYNVYILIILKRNLMDIFPKMYKNNFLYNITRMYGDIKNVMRKTSVYISLLHTRRYDIERTSKRGKVN